jgi:hypothetical protein
MTSRREAVRRAEVERFPATTVVVAGLVMSVVGVIIGIGTATGAITPHDGEGVAIALGFLLLMIILVLAGHAVRAVEGWRIEQLRDVAEE